MSKPSIRCLGVMKQLRIQQESFSLVRMRNLQAIVSIHLMRPYFYGGHWGFLLASVWDTLHQLNSKRDRRFWFSQMMHTRGKDYTLKSWVGSFWISRRKQSWMKWATVRHGDTRCSRRTCTGLSPTLSSRRAVDWRALWNEYSGLLLNGTVFVFMLIGCWLVIHKVRRRITYRKNPTPYWVYVSALDALSEQGWVRRNGESPEQFASRIQLDCPSFTPIVWAQVGQVFGDEQTDGSILRQYRERLSSENY